MTATALLAFPSTAALSPIRAMFVCTVVLPLPERHHLRHEGRRAVLLNHRHPGYDVGLRALLLAVTAAALALSPACGRMGRCFA
jgi:hypothetical protein